MFLPVHELPLSSKRDMKPWTLGLENDKTLRRVEFITNK